MEYLYDGDFTYISMNIIKETLRQYSKSKRPKIIIYPFGSLGKIAKAELNTYFGIKEYMVIDNELAKEFELIKSLSDVTEEDKKDAIVFVASTNVDVYDELRECLYSVFEKEQCVELTHRTKKMHTPFRGIEEYGLNHELYKLAQHESVMYITEHMLSAKSYSNRFELLTHSIYDYVEDNEGLFLEFGVYKGESINYISTLKPYTTIYGFDSFEGLPEDWRPDIKKGCFDLRGNMPFVNGNVKLIKGWFEDTLPDFLKSHKEDVSFLHVDSDIYSSAKTILSCLKNRIHTGTVIVFDEYFNRPGWKMNEYRAWQEFVEENEISYEYIGFNGGTYMGCQVGIRVI